MLALSGRVTILIDLPITFATAHGCAKVMADEPAEPDTTSEFRERREKFVRDHKEKKRQEKSGKLSEYRPPAEHGRAHIMGLITL